MRCSRKAVTLGAAPPALLLGMAQGSPMEREALHHPGDHAGAVEESVTVLRDPEMASGSVYKKLKRFGWPSSRLDRSGFSDHYPIAVTLREEG